MYINRWPDDPLRRIIAGVIITIVLLLLSPLSLSATPLYGEDLVFPPKGFGRPHGASLVELPGGDLMATWFSSREETSSDARIFGSRWSRKNGQWGEPFTVVDETYAKSLGNTALFRDDDDIIWMFFAAVRIGGWSGAMVDYVQSRDDGRSWSEGKNMVGWLGNLPRNPPIKIGDHEMLVPLFIDFWYEANLVGSYTARLKYRDGKIVKKTYASLDDYDAIQPTVVRLDDGSILLLARDKSDQYIRRAWSTDNGDNWSTVTPTGLPNPGAAICAIYLKELGAVLLAYNHSTEGRSPLSLAISFDGGKKFMRIADLAKAGKKDPDASFSYPALLRTSDGVIHIIWSHDSRATLKHAFFDLQWLKDAINNRVQTRQNGKD